MTVNATTQPEAEVRRSAGVRASLLEYLHACPVCGHAGLRHYGRVASLYNPGEFIRQVRGALLEAAA